MDGVWSVGVRRQIFEPKMGTQYFPKFLQSRLDKGLISGLMRVRDIQQTWVSFRGRVKVG